VVVEVKRSLPLADPQLERLTGLRVVNCDRHPPVVGVPQQPNVDPVAEPGRARRRSRRRWRP
jgi:hypothetical protein